MNKIQFHHFAGPEKFSFTTYHSPQQCYQQH